MIEINNLTHVYGKTTALKQIFLKATNGRIYGVFGRKGAGKSTLLALLAGALLPTQGSVRINGFDTSSEHRAAAKCVGYAPCQAKFYRNMTVYELLDFTAEAKGVQDERRFLHVHEIMERLGLEPIRDRLISRLSALDLKCLSLAQALMNSPEILLLDEPTEGLGHTERKMVLNLIAEIAEDGKTVFFASSIPSEILSICNDVILLSQGTAESSVPLSELLRSTEVQVSIRGERDRVEQAFSEIAGVISCRRCPSVTEGTLEYTVKGEGEGFPKAVERVLTANGFSAATVRIIPPSEEARALRSAKHPFASTGKEGENA